MESLKQNPIPFVTPPTSTSPAPTYGLLTYSIAKTLLFDTMYTPNQIGSAIASAFASALSNDSQPLYSFSLDATISQLFDASCDPAANRINANPVSALAVACGDGKPVEPDLSALKTYFAGLAKQSIFWDVWPVRVGCA